MARGYIQDMPRGNVTFMSFIAIYEQDMKIGYVSPIKTRQLLFRLFVEYIKKAVTIPDMKENCICIYCRENQ